MMKYLFNLSFILLIFSLSACAPTIKTRNKEPETYGVLKGFEKKLVKGDQFWITTYQRITNRNMPFVFYIEGDGFAFYNRYRVSDNPTPLHPMVLKLAAKDSRPNIVYIARPCQYTDMSINPTCNTSYWTDKRMSEEVIRSLNEVIQTVNNGQKFSLIGWSGGGGMAVLIAARNKNVKDIITIAGNLDHMNFNKYHNARPMIGSLNPIDYAANVRNIPQLHVSGGKDKIVPPFITDGYVRKAASPCVHQEILTDVTHDKGWDKAWDYILRAHLTCY